MSKKTILIEARDGMIAERDARIAKKKAEKDQIAATKLAEIQAQVIEPQVKKLDDLLNGAIREFTEQHTKEAKALADIYNDSLVKSKASYDAKVKSTREDTENAKIAFIQKQKEKATQSIEAQYNIDIATIKNEYDSEISNFNKLIEAIKE